ncbi:MAG: hypothetical protein ACO263_09090 [Cyclobacteriaceae bacterium]
MAFGNLIRTSLFLLQIIFYSFAGINHFINPDVYWPLIPDYLSELSFGINLMAGTLELSLALLLIPKQTRKMASLGIILLLIAFIPSHIHFITSGLTAVGPLKVTTEMAWIRLVLIHPLLIWWAWSARFFTGNFFKAA